MIQAYIAIGSNLGNPFEKAQLAVNALTKLPQVTDVVSSPFYVSKPMGPQDQPDYVNAVVGLKTQLSPHELLKQTQAIELAFGRERKGERWGPRTLDLDILLYGDVCLDDPILTIPHYGMKEREFVLYPLAQIAPNLTLPDGSSIQNLLKMVDPNGLVAINTQKQPVT